MNGFETTLQRWHDYYVATGGARPRLLGLLFVGLSLHLDREASEEYDMLYRLGTQTMIDLAYTLAFALLTLIPISDPMVLGGVLLVSSLGGALDSLRTIARRGWLHGWTPYASVGCFAGLIFSSVVLLFGAGGSGLLGGSGHRGPDHRGDAQRTWELLIRARGARR
jgi:hypothetical protein